VSQHRVAWPLRGNSEDAAGRDRRCHAASPSHPPLAHLRWSRSWAALSTSLNKHLRHRFFNVRENRNLHARAKRNFPFSGTLFQGRPSPLSNVGPMFRDGAGTKSPDRKNIQGSSNLCPTLFREGRGEHTLEKRSREKGSCFLHEGVQSPSSHSSVVGRAALHPTISLHKQTQQHCKGYIQFQPCRAACCAC